jgi:acetyl-CoA carboxylase, biotin carboxylase subunit
VKNATSNLLVLVKKQSMRWETKIHARQLMQKAGVPVIPGSDGSIDSLEEAEKLAEEIGYPVMLKAAAGGGGKGIRKVPTKSELEKHFLSAKSEAKAVFW